MWYDNNLINKSLIGLLEIKHNNVKLIQKYCGI
jgi:hypothetical protein